MVLIFLPTSPDVLAAFMGAMMLGAVPALMPLPSAKQNPAAYWSSHRALLKRIRPRILVTDRAHADAMVANKLIRGRRRLVVIEDVPEGPAEAPAPSAAPDDVALLQHSSGTTSLKKGVMLSHGAILRQVEAYAATLNATADDAMASWLPVYHDMGLIACSMMPLVLGQTVTLLSPFQWVARPAVLFDAMERYGCSLAWMPNFAFEHLTRTVPEGWSGDLSGVRALIDCSEPCKADTFDRFLDRFAKHGLKPEALQVCYAMAETVFAVSQTPPGRPVAVVEVDRETLRTDRRAEPPAGPERAERLLSNGPVVDGLSVTIRDPRGVPLADGEVGEIAIAGDFLFSGYHNAPEITAERLRDGVYFTRDLGFLRDGELFVLGRKDDLLIVNGRNLRAHEVEGIVTGVAGLKPGRAVAFGVFNDATASEELVVVAERDGSGRDDEAIARDVRERVFDETGIDVRDVAVVAPDWLVKTTSGKISRDKNRAKYLESAGEADRPVASTAKAAAEDCFAAIVRIVGRSFRYPAERVTRRTTASDVRGWDSLAHATLMIEVEKELGIAFPDDEIFGFPDIGALAGRAAELRAAGGPGARRAVLDTPAISIVRVGEPNDGPDIVILAGLAPDSGREDVLDFAVTLNGTKADRYRKYFVTDRRREWFSGEFEAIADAINAVSDRSKVVIGNSMGGYGALSVAPLLTHVVAILAVVPQRLPRTFRNDEDGADAERYLIRPTPGVPTCILYGEVEDRLEKSWVASVFTDAERQKMLIVPNCGHDVVRYLHKRKLLEAVLLASLDPPTMLRRVSKLVAKVKPSAGVLTTRVLKLPTGKREEALDHLTRRRGEEGLPPLTQAEIDAFEQRRRSRHAR